MAKFSRRRSNKVKLNNRLGSRRNRFLFSLATLLFVAAGYLAVFPIEAEGAGFLVAVTDLPSNTLLNESNSTRMNLSLGEQENYYIRSTEKQDQWLLTKAVRAGELIPLSAVDDSQRVDCVNLRIDLNLRLGKDIHSGDRIDLWSAPANAIEGAIPNQIVTSAELIALSESTDALSQNQTEIEVCISRAEVRSLVNAIAQKEVVVAVRGQ